MALPHGPSFRLASDLAVSSVDVRSVVAGPLNGRIVSWQGGGACLGLAAFFTFATEHASILLRLLPSLVHIRSHAGTGRTRLHVTVSLRAALQREGWDFGNGISDSMADAARGRPTHELPRFCLGHRAFTRLRIIRLSRRSFALPMLGTIPVQNVGLLQQKRLSSLPRM